MTPDNALFSFSIPISRLTGDYAAGSGASPSPPVATAGRLVISFAAAFRVRFGLAGNGIFHILAQLPEILARVEYDMPALYAIRLELIRGKSRRGSLDGHAEVPHVGELDNVPLQGRSASREGIPPTQPSSSPREKEERSAIRLATSLILTTRPLRATA